MSVFIVLGVWYYEGCEILGVFDSFEKAQALQAEVTLKEANYRAAREAGQPVDLMIPHSEITIEERTVQ